MPYVDAFVLAVPRNNLARYKKIARYAGKLSKQHGALEYRECIGDDLVTIGTPFDKLLKLKQPSSKNGEALVFSWVVYKSKAHRDAANKKIMADPRLNEMCGGGGPGARKNPPFDIKRMSMAGCKFLVDM